MSAEQIAALAFLIVPILLVALVVRGFRRSAARDLAEVSAFQRAYGLRGTADPFSLSGTFEGMPCYATVESEPGERTSRSVTRFRVLLGDAAGYRDARATSPGALVVARNAAVPFDRVSGMHESPTGDPVFDAAYRAFVQPGAASPWSDPSMRAALVWLGASLERAERGAAESSVTLLGEVSQADVLGRALLVAASLASPQSAQRHAAQLATPFDGSPRPEQAGLPWAVARMLFVCIVGMIAVFPLSFLPPVNDLTEVIACDDGEVLTTVGVPNGRGVNVVCMSKRGGWWFLVALDVGIAAVLVAFSGVELVVRIRGAARRR